jgi:hypothetical protein
MKEFRIDHASRVVVVEYSGVVTNEDFLQGQQEYGVLDGSYSLLVDLSRTTDFKVTTDDLRRLAGRFTPERRGRCAVIAPSDVGFGLSRMIEVYAQNPGFAVFRTEQQAREWLALQSP